MAPRPQMAGSRRRRPILGLAAAAAAAAVLGHSFLEAAFSQPCPAVEPEVVSRRSLAALGAVSAVGVRPSPAKAVFGLFEGPKLTAYTMPGVYNISMSPRYKLKKEAPGLLAWQGDRLQPTEVMTAKAKAVEFTSLARALGGNVTEVGMRMGAERPSVRINSTVEAALADASVDPYETGLDIYRFEWVSDFIHEYKLYALVKAQGKNYLCSVNVRTPALLWEENKELFEYILKSFTPLEAQPNRTSEEVPASAARVAPAEANEGAL